MGVWEVVFLFLFFFSLQNLFPPVTFSGLSGLLFGKELIFPSGNPWGPQMKV